MKFENSPTEDGITPFPKTNDPWGLFNESIKDSILMSLADAFEVSPSALPSLYLTRCLFVSAENKDGRLSLHFALHVKEVDHAHDVAHVSVKTVVESRRIE